MSRGLYMLGASGDALRSQAIVMHIDHIDAAVLKSKVGGLAGLALDLSDVAPKAFLDAALPIAAQQLKQYGIDARLAASDAPTVERGKSEFWSGLVVGGALGGGAWAIWKYGLSRLFGG